MAISTISQYSRLMYNSNSLRERQQNVEEQIGTGYKARNFSGLETDAIRSLDIRSKMEAITSYKANIDKVRTRVNVMDTVMVRVSEIAKNVQRELLRLADSSNQNALVVNSIAREGLAEVTQLLNTQVDGRYLFSGSSTGKPPIRGTAELVDAAETIYNNAFPPVAPDTVQSELTNPIGDLIYNPANAYTAPSGGNAQGLFNSELAEGDYRISAQVDVGFEVSYGVKADAAFFRDVIYGLTVAAAVEVPADPADNQPFLDFINNGRQVLERGRDRLDQEIGIVGAARNRMDATYDKHEAIETILKGTLGELEETDVAEAATRLKLLETQIQATYSIIGNQSRFSLVDFLT